jgi:hypothetical protein
MAPWGPGGSGGARIPACLFSKRASWVSDVEGRIGRRADQGLVLVGTLSDPSSGDQDPVARVPPTAARPPKGALGRSSWGDSTWVCEWCSRKMSIHGFTLELTAIALHLGLTNAPLASSGRIRGQQEGLSLNRCVASC